MIFALGPLLGPVLGPIVGSLVAQNVGWRWLMGVLAMFTGVLLIISIFTIPETYAPILLRRRASRLSKLTGKVYVSHFDASAGRVRPGKAFQKAFKRPWILLFREPIVLLLSLYQSIVLGILYLLFEAFPFVYEQGRGWSQVDSGLTFLAPVIGALIGQCINVWNDRRFNRLCKSDPSGFAAPEERLPAACAGAVAIPIGLFWFAWTNDPRLNCFISIAAGIPLGAGICTVMVSIQNYLVDVYTIYAASVLAGCVVMRSILAAVFPFFTPYMYENLGIHWASSIPGFLALFCVPMPFLLYWYGVAIRKRCIYTKKAELALKRIREQTPDNKPSAPGERSSTPTETDVKYNPAASLDQKSEV
jgi:MFS family permease